MEYLSRSLDLASELGCKNCKLSCLYNIGFVHRSLGNPNSANECFYEGVLLSIETNQHDQAAS